MRFLRRVADLKLCDQIKSSSIRESLQIEPILIHIERSQLRWLGHVLSMPPNRLPNQVFQAAPTGRRPVGRSRTSWRKYMEKTSSGTSRPPMDRDSTSGTRSKSMDTTTKRA